jgi:hypothetical protein
MFQDGVAVLGIIVLVLVCFFGQFMEVCHFDPLLGKFAHFCSKFVKHFSPLLKCWSKFMKRRGKFVQRFSKFVKRCSPLLKRWSKFVKRRGKFAQRFSKTLKRFGSGLKHCSKFVLNFSVLL